jgi:hypothetical protein
MRAIACCLLVVTTACHQRPRPVPPVGSGAAGPDAAVPVPDLALGSRPPMDLAGVDDCSGTALVYVLSLDGTLYRFDPPNLTFTSIGALACPGEQGQSYTAMAIDRSDRAWVRAADDRVFLVSTINAACVPSVYAPFQHNEMINDFAFSADVSGAPAETLFVSLLPASGIGAGIGIGAIDGKTLATTVIGNDGDPLWAYPFIITGTKDARLFGLFAGNPGPGPSPSPVGGVPGYTVAQLDKTSGGILSKTVITQLTPRKGWAWAFWGGDFYLFSDNGEASSIVFRHRPSDGTTIDLKHGVGFFVTGAGVSTCAPTMIK